MAASLGGIKGQVLDVGGGRLDLNTLEVFLLLLTDIIGALRLGNKQSVRL